MARKNLKKDFDKDMMYRKIMPTILPDPDEPDPPSQKPEVPARAEIPLLPEPDPRSGQRYLLRNYMEDLAQERLEHIVQMLKGCGCEKCRKDVMAVALNSLPPAYMALGAGELAEALRTLRAEQDIKVAAALIKAVQAVKRNPQHE